MKVTHLPTASLMALVTTPFNTRVRLTAEKHRKKASYLQPTPRQHITLPGFPFTAYYMCLVLLFILVTLFEL